MNINFILTRDTATDICQFFGQDINALEDYQVCELLDKLIDQALVELDRC